MGIRRLPVIAVFLATLTAPGLAQNLAAPDRPSDDYYLRNPDRSARDRAGTSVVLSGTVSSIDRDRESIRLRTRRGLQTVELYDGTRLLDDSGRRASLSDIRVGDELQVSGAERNGRIVADRVTLLVPVGTRYPNDYREAAPYAPHRVIVVGTVRTPTYDVGRQVKVRTSDGDISVDVDPHTPITAYSDRISVHELERGDRVRVVGEWTGTDRLRADRIDVLPPPRQAARGYRSSLAPMPVVTVIGQLVSYDRNRDRMRLSTRDGDRIVIAKGTPAYVRGERIDRGDMRQGDRVRATGYWDGREILATRVELAY
jgi:hypothetical protein